MRVKKKYLWGKYRQENLLIGKAVACVVVYKHTDNTTNNKKC